MARKKNFGAPTGTQQPCITEYIPGSIKRVWAVPIQYIEQFDEEHDTLPHWEEVIILNEGKEWKSYYFAPNTAIFKEEGKHSPSGPYYEQELRGFRPGSKKEVFEEIQRLMHGYYVLILEFWNKDARIWGSPTLPVQFVGSITSGNQRSSPQGTDWRFFRRSTSNLLHIQEPPDTVIMLESPCELISMADFRLYQWMLSSGDLQGIRVELNPNGYIAAILNYKNGLLFNPSGAMVEVMNHQQAPSFSPNRPAYVSILSHNITNGWEFRIEDLPVRLKTGETCQLTFSQTYSSTLIGAYSGAYSSAYN